MNNLVLVHGKFHTQDPALGPVTAVNIRDGRFLAVGSDDAIKAIAEPGSRVIDLQGRRVLPGLMDAHFHYYDWALGRRRIVLAGVPSLRRLQDRVAQAVGKAAPGGWIIGQGWNETLWPDPVMPTREDLDTIAPAHPVLLWRTDMHVAVANTLALRMAGITAGTADPPMGSISKDAAGQPTGLLRDLAVNLVYNRIPPVPDEDVAEAFRDGFSFLHSLGLTGVQDQRLLGAPEGAQAFRAWQRLREERKLDLRIWTNLPGESLREIIALGLRTGMGDDFLRIGHVKYFADGGHNARTAWMLEPYDDTGTTGTSIVPMGELEEALRAGQKAGLAIAVHSIGDRANHELSRLFEKVLGDHAASAGNASRVPHRIEHMEMIRPEDHKRVIRPGLMASVQPISVPDDMDMMDASIGRRSAYCYNWRTLMDAGAQLAFGSDCPVCDPNPFWGIHAAVTRRKRDGTPPGGWHPEQRLTVAEAVWGYSMGSAIASGWQADLGSISPGKLADLVVVDRDIFAIDPMEICEAKPWMTLFDGRIVHGPA